MGEPNPGCVGPFTQASHTPPQASHTPPQASHTPPQASPPHLEHQCRQQRHGLLRTQLPQQPTEHSLRGHQLVLWGGGREEEEEWGRRSGGGVGWGGGGTACKDVWKGGTGGIDVKAMGTGYGKRRIGAWCGGRQVVETGRGAEGAGVCLWLSGCIASVQRRRLGAVFSSTEGPVFNTTAVQQRGPPTHIAPPRLARPTCVDCISQHTRPLRVTERSGAR